jgi:hypothetical protein
MKCKHTNGANSVTRKTPLEVTQLTCRLLGNQVVGVAGYAKCCCMQGPHLVIVAQSQDSLILPEGLVCVEDHLRRERLEQRLVNLNGRLHLQKVISVR